MGSMALWPPSILRFRAKRATSSTSGCLQVAWLKHKPSLSQLRRPRC